MGIKKFTIRELLDAIHEKYETLDSLGEVLEISKQNISGKLRRQSPKFLNQLKSVGIVLPYKQEKNISSNESELQNIISKLVKENFELKEENVKLKILVDTHCKKSNRSSVR
jgi:hypothetical protein